MRRTRRAFLKQPSEPLERAESVGVALPAFNFIEPRTPKSPRSRRNQSQQQSPRLPRLGAPTATLGTHELVSAVGVDGAKSSIDCEEILYRTVSHCAAQMDEPTLSQESKTTRVWQSMLRHSDLGRFGGPGSSPNRVCSALCLEVVRQVLAACGASALLCEVLLGGLANSIFVRFDPGLPYATQQQYADVVVEQLTELERKQQELADMREEHEARASQANPQLLATTLALKKMDTTVRSSAITELISPYLTDDLFLVLWNAMATTRAYESIDHSNTPLHLDDDGISEDSGDPQLSVEVSRKRASAMANLVLQERVRLVLTFWQALSFEEQNVMLEAFQADGERTESSATQLKSVLRALEETYIAEQIHGHRQTSGRYLLLPSRSPGAQHADAPASSVGGRAGASYRRSIVAVRKRIASSFASTDHPQTEPNQAQPLVESDANAARNSENQLISIPDVLLGMFGSHPHDQSSDSRGTTLTATDDLSVDQLRGAHEAVLRKCEEVFDLLCEESDDVEDAARGAHRRDLAARQDQESLLLSATAPAPEVEDSLAQAKRGLCELLCAFVMPTDGIVEKLAKSEEARERQRRAKLESEESAGGSSALVQTIIQQQKLDPSLLVSAINQSPEVLLSAVAQNLGILRFTIIKFAGPVKRFLKLDPKACDHLDSLVQKNRGVQLLWGTNLSAVDSVLGVGNMGGEEYLVSTAAGGQPGLGVAGAGSYLVDWFTSHTSELSALFLRQPELLKDLFVDMHQRGDVSAFYRLMLQLQSTRGVQNFMRRASVATLERVAQEDPSEILRLLREVFHEDEQGGPNRDLLDQLRSSQYLVTCLSEFHPTALQDILSSHIDTWKHYFVDTAASHDGILRESLLLRAENVEGGDALVRIFDAVVDGSTAALNLEAIDLSASPSDLASAKERESSTRRKMQQCLYLRGGSTVFRALISPQIASVGFSPRGSMVGAACDAAGAGDSGVGEGAAGGDGASSAAAVVAQFYTHAKAKETKAAKATPIRVGRGRRVPAQGSPRRRLHRTSASKEELGEIAAAAAAFAASSDLAAEAAAPSAPTPSAPTPSTSAQSLPPPPTHEPVLPSMWQTYLRAFFRQQSDKPRAPLKLSRANVKTLVLDICLEFLKADHLQLDNACLWTIAPFVCDYFIVRYESPALVGCWLLSFAEGLLAFQDDARVAFFCAASGLAAAPSGYDVFLYYLHALGHLFFGQMKIFKPENRLEETADGACPVPAKHVAAVADTLFGFALSGSERRQLQQEIADLPAAPHATSAEPASSETAAADADAMVELDDAMAVFVAKWAAATEQVDSRYRQAFELHDAGSGRIGLEQFTRVVTGVTSGRISARECRLVFGDVGHEFLDLDTLLRVTRAYHLRLFNAHLPEVPFCEHELHELRLSVGRTNVSSVERETEDLARCWRSVRDDLVGQLEASHQNRATKTLLRKQNALVERLLGDVQQRAQLLPTRDALELLGRAWHEIRACAKMLHTAKLTQHYLSRLFLQFSLLKWVRHARQRTQGDERRRALEQLSA